MTCAVKINQNNSIIIKLYNFNKYCLIFYRKTHYIHKIHPYICQKKKLKLYKKKVANQDLIYLEANEMQ